jgi:hypothetical protein
VPKGIQSRGSSSQECFRVTERLLHKVPTSGLGLSPRSKFCLQTAAFLEWAMLG